MKVLVIGSGGREHAIVWKLSQNKKIRKIYCAPGNAGISQLAECVSIAPTDILGLAKFAKDTNIDLTVVGMDDPLMLGIVDVFEKEGLRIFGPNKKAAIIEGSKVFSKELMMKYNIPTAKYYVFNDSNQAMEYIKNNNEYPIVLKADGLALGKGVLICANEDEALSGIKEIMIDKKFGNAGEKIVIEEFITGQEVSVLAFCDGETIIPMVSAQDHKRALDNDKGLNTGGMGTFSPSRYYTKDIKDYCMKHIYIPTVKAMKAEGRMFKGILFFGMMLTDKGPKLLEYNARFGDPEAQVVLPRLKTDLLEIIEKCIDGQLKTIDIQWENYAAVCVVLASGGYPISYKKGYTIQGLEKFKDSKETIIFHAGTVSHNGNIVTNGGRVLGVTAIANDLDKAIEKAYASVKNIYFQDMHYRNDIGVK